MTGDAPWRLPASALICFGDSPESFWVRQVRDLYIYTVAMEVDEFESLIAVALTGQRPDDDRLPAYAPLEERELPNPWYAELDFPSEGIGTKRAWR